jgi:3-isopropylmalate/(R)-2-methylmalate dehydratase small subunit
MIIETKNAWVFGDEIDTDMLAPGQYMKGPIEEMAKHCLEALDPSFASTVKQGDVVVAGEFFGMGSSREQAAEALLHLGVRAVIAKSFGRIFYRNALNLGLPAVACANVDRIRAGDALRIDVGAGRIENRSRNESYDCEKIPSELLDMIEAGGLIPHLEKRLKAKPA